MTNERAIELLNRISDCQFDGIHGDERREALSMAVRALEGDGDTISRKALMKEFSDFVRKSNNSDFAPTPTWNDAVSLVGSIPSVQPQACDDAISRKMAIDEVKRLHDVAWANWKETRISANTMIDALKDLPSAQPETHDKRTETHACDLISREQAIDAVKDLPNCRNGFSDTYDKACIIGVLEDLTTAQPQWISCSERLPEEDEDVLVCSEDGDIDIACWMPEQWTDEPHIEWWSGEYRVFAVAWMPLPKPYGGDTK